MINLLILRGYFMSYTYENVFVNSDYPNVTAIEANQFYNNNVPGFDDKTIFYCSEHCSAEISCANYQVDFSDTKNKNRVTPYFVNRKKQVHSLSCSRWLEISKKRKGVKEQTAHYTQTGNEFVIEFLTGKGLIPNQSTPSKSDATIIDSTGSKTSSTKPKKSTPSKNRTPHKSGLKEIVRLFEEYQEGNNLIQLFDKNHNPIKFNDIFEKIDRKKPTTVVSNLPKIYYGQAKAEIKDENSLRITFTGKATLSNIENKNISFLLYRQTCEKNRKKSFYNELEKMAKLYKEKRKNYLSYFTLYYEGNFKIYDNKFINLNQENIKEILKHIVITPN